MPSVKSNYDKARVYGWQDLMNNVKDRAAKKYPNEHIVDTNARAILRAFVEEVEDLIGKGYKVRIGNIGFLATTAIHAHTVNKSVMFPDKTKDRNSYRKVMFSPAGALRKFINKPEYDKVKQIELIETDFRNLLRKGYTKQGAYDFLEDKFSGSLFDIWQNNSIEILKNRKQ